ncbi:MAG: flippase-like domain-containing protein [Bacteroidetes bacterium]|nr:flippase-like domain-containing protein [Bacteroidota bacterium]
MGTVINILKYLIAFAVACLLLWLVYRHIDIGRLFTRLGDVKYKYVIISIAIMLIAHLVRAYRWSLLLSPIGYPVSTWRMFLAIMVGYLANLFFPRMGEITRCGVLKRTNNVPMAISIGSVVAERIVDLLTLISLIIFNMLIEYDLLSGFFKDFFSSKFSGVVQNLMVLYVFAGAGFFLLIIGYFFLRVYKEKLKRIPLFLKIRAILRELGEGLSSIGKLKKKAHFWISSGLMWLLYYALTYIVVFSIDETSHLSLIAGLTILVTGSIGMATPVQGGIGAFHALVSGVLILYGVVFEDGILFATVLHSSQVLTVILFGGISLIVTVFLQRKRISNQKLQQNIENNESA